MSSPKNTAGSSEPLAELTVYRRAFAWDRVRAWLGVVCPAGCAKVTFVGGKPVAVETSIPRYWFYDFTAHRHVPAIPSSPQFDQDAYQEYCFDRSQFEIDVYTVEGPMPACPL